MAEETGLVIDGELAAGYVVHDFAPTDDNVVIFAFEAVATGTPAHDDPDGDVIAVQFLLDQRWDRASGEAAVPGAA